MGFFERSYFIHTSFPPPNFYCFLQAIFFGGVDVSIRGEVWPFLLRYYSHESTSEEREALRVQKRKEYADIQQKRCPSPPPCATSPTEPRRKMSFEGQLEVQFSIDNMCHEPWFLSKMGLPGVGVIRRDKGRHYTTHRGLRLSRLAPT